MPLLLGTFDVGWACEPADYVTDAYPLGEAVPAGTWIFVEDWGGSHPGQLVATDGTTIELGQPEWVNTGGWQGYATPTDLSDGTWSFQVDDWEIGEFVVDAGVVPAPPAEAAVVTDLAVSVHDLDSYACGYDTSENPYAGFTGKVVAPVAASPGWAVDVRDDTDVSVAWVPLSTLGETTDTFLRLRPWRDADEACFTATLVSPTDERSDTTEPVCIDAPEADVPEEAGGCGRGGGALLLFGLGGARRRRPCS